MIHCVSPARPNPEPGAELALLNLCQEHPEARGGPVWLIWLILGPTKTTLSPSLGRGGLAHGLDGHQVGSGFPSAAAEAQVDRMC